MRVAARPENRFKPRRLILTFSYRFAKFPNSFFSLQLSSISRVPAATWIAKAFPSHRKGKHHRVPKFPYLPYFVRPANPALCKLRFIPQTVNVFLSFSVLSSCHPPRSIRRKILQREKIERQEGPRVHRLRHYQGDRDISRSYIIDHLRRVV